MRLRCTVSFWARSPGFRRSERCSGAPDPSVSARRSRPSWRARSRSANCTSRIPGAPPNSSSRWCGAMFSYGTSCSSKPKAGRLKFAPQSRVRSTPLFTPLRPTPKLRERRLLRSDHRAAIIWSRRRLLLPVLRPWRQRPRNCGAVQPDLVDALVEEAEIAFDLRAFRDRIGVAPDEIFEHLIADLDRVVAGLAFVGAPRDRLARHEKAHAHILGRDVIAGRQPGFEQKAGSPRLGNDLASDHHLHRA